MPLPREPYKYLIYYPFSVLTVSKAFNLVIYTLAVYVWHNTKHPMDIGPILYLLPISDLIGCAIASISLWFMIQKFYWKKVEIVFNASGVLLSLFGLLMLVTNHNTLSAPADYIFMNHLFTTTAWLFCLYWSATQTSNNVSNLFISEWGQGTEEIEIEALEGHF